MTHELHPLCTLFPRLGAAEFAALVADIKANGLREPITLHDGMILDGGNRYRACIEAGIEPTFREFDGGNIVSFVLSANLHRRHMTAGQQAAIVASAQDWARAQPANRPRKECNLAPLDTAASRAAESGSSLRTQKMADKVAKADPALAKQVAQGAVSLPRAVEQVTGKRPGARPKPEPARESDDDGAPSAEELAEIERIEAADRALIDKMLEADDALAAMVAENKRLNAVVAALELRIRGLQNEANEAIKSAKYWQRQAQKKAA